MTPAPDYFGRMSSTDIQKWLDFNRELNSTPLSQAWLHRAFASSMKMGIVDEPSLDHCLLVSSDSGELVAGIIVSSKEHVLCCLLVNDQGELDVDMPQTEAFQDVKPDHLVAFLLGSRAMRNRLRA